MNKTARRFLYIFLCTFPFFELVVVGVRALRIPGLYQVMGGVLFAVIVIAAWIVGARVVSIGAAEGRRLALAGTLLVFPWALVALLWVGLGAPFQATISENHMRFLVLLANSILITSAFVVLKEELYAASEHFYATIGFAASALAGTAYLLCISMSVAQTMVALQGQKNPTLNALGEFYSVLEFVACVMTYVTTAAFAASLGRAGWLGRGAARAYITACAVLVLFLLMRGLSYPEISGQTAPWYTQPGVIAGIPAIPWLMPSLLGVVLLKRAGDEHLSRA
jgi:hypothetical protein